MKYILKRILIGVSIGVLLMIIKGNFLMVVDALQPVDGNIIGYTFPPEMPVINEENFYWTNIWGKTNYTPGITQLNTYANYNYDIRDFNGDNNILDSDYISFVNIKNTDMTIYGKNTLCSLNSTWCIGNSHPFVGVQGIDLQFGPLDNNNWAPDNGSSDTWDSFIKVESGSTYSMLVGIQKDSNLSFYDRTDLNISLNFRGSLYTNGSLSTPGVGMNNYMRIDTLEWLSPSNITNGNPNQAYIKIRFTMDSPLNDSNNDNYYLGYSDYFYMTRLFIDVGSTPGDNANNNTPFIYNTSNNDGNFNIYNLSFVEEGFIDITGQGGSIPDYSALDLDTLTNYDLAIVESLETQCSNTDIICHLQNIFNYIKQIFINIRNFFQGIIDFIYHIFIPTGSQIEDLKNYFLLQLDELTDKLGFFAFPFQVISDIFTIYINVLTHNTSNYVITIPALREPIWNNVIYNGGTLDFGYIINYGVIKNLYDIYYMFISVYIILLFLDLCYDSFGSFISGNLHTSSSYTQQDLEMFNNNTGEVYTTTRTIKTTHRNIRS